MDDQECPRCKTTKYRKPTLKLMVNICGHPLCEGCVDLLFLKGTGNCYECNQPLRRGNFKEQLFDDSHVEKEVEIRKKLLKEYNKVEEDFNSVAEYNDYLEEFEEIIFNLCNDIDILETNKRIDSYKKANKDNIMRNKIRQSKAERELCIIIEEEKEAEAKKRSQLYMMELASKKRKVANKEALIDELTHTTAGAKDIVSVYASRMNSDDYDDVDVASSSLLPLTGIKAGGGAHSQELATHFSSGIRIGAGGLMGLSVPAPIVQQLGPLYVYEPIVKLLDGPDYPSWDDIACGTYLKHVRAESVEEKAGGYASSIATMRALHDAFAGLFHTNKPAPLPEPETVPQEPVA
uniref:CDK-activating kinase assembly factor MAT1 n=1 Tax=Cacopsylla melanoneura TaxID=428564 RepID=A0A8D8YPI9_9HEMI